MKQFFRIDEYPIWIVVFFALVGLIPILIRNEIDLFFACIETGISIAVAICAITQNKDTTVLSHRMRKIDKIVYDIYDLTDAEIKIIEQAI